MEFCLVKDPSKCQHLSKAGKYFTHGFALPKKLNQTAPETRPFRQKGKACLPTTIFRGGVAVSFTKGVYFFHPSSSIFTSPPPFLYVPPTKISLGNGLEVDVIEMPAHFMERWAFDSRHN